MKSPGIKVTQSQRLQLNTSLQASIRLLRADATGLTRYLEEQAAENPAIRLDYAKPMPGEWLPRWTSAFAAATDPVAFVESGAPSLIAHVTAQVSAMDMTRHERRVALALVEALEPSGWLGTAPPQIATDLAVPTGVVDAVLARLQGMEPAGLFARDLRECLLLQARAEGFADAGFEAVLRHLDLLASGDVARLAQRAGISAAEVDTHYRRIRSLDPKPGARFAAHAAPVREPDLLVHRADGGWQVALNRSALPSVTVADGRGAGRAAARGLARLVDGRNASVLRVGQQILHRQSAALDRGLAALVPMTMADIAEAVGLHESTVSRIVAGVAVDTPRGTWWLRALFGGKRGQAVTGDLSAPALRARLADLVAAEDPARPLSDAALTAALAAMGAAVARRTVADYREALGIPPAHRRRQRP